MAGLTADGFTALTQPEIRESLNARAKSVYGPDVRVDDQSVLGQLLGIESISLADLWQLAQLLYDSFNPDNAQGLMLDNIAAITGVRRDPATKATGS